MNEPPPTKQQQQKKKTSLWALQSEILVGNLDNWVMRDNSKESVAEFTKSISSTEIS